jgi:hypothetical protein
MNVNVGTKDRVVRIGLALFFLVVLIAAPAPIRWIPLFGIVPLLTEFVGFCPLYTLLGLNTCVVKE